MTGRRFGTILAWTPVAAYRQCKERIKQRMIVNLELIKERRQEIRPVVPPLHVAWRHSSR
jgi:hypothetical protein